MTAPAFYHHVLTAAAIQTPTQRRRKGKGVQHPATAASLADGGSPPDPLPVAATTEKGASRTTVATDGPRRVVALGALTGVLAVVVTVGIVKGIESTATTLAGLTSSGLGSSLGFHGDRAGLAALLLLIPALVLGQMVRGYLHARGIRKSHFHAIKGIGLALVLFIVAMVLLFWGAS